MREIYKDVVARFNNKEITREQFHAECAKIAIANPLPKTRRRRMLGESRSQKKIAEDNLQADQAFWQDILSQVEIES